MNYIVFALFRSKEAADAAARHLVQAEQEHEEHISLILHEEVLDKEQLHEQVQHGDLDESDTARGLAIGASLGAAAGAVVGTLLAGPFGLLGGGPLVGLLFGAGSGSVYGMLGAGLVGTGLTDQNLKRLAERLTAGDALLTVRTPDKATEKRVAAILRQHGATIEEKRLLG